MTANRKTTRELEDGHTRKIADEIVESGENEAGTKNRTEPMADCYTQFVRMIRDLPAGEERRLAIWLLYAGAKEEEQEALAHLALVQELRDLEDTLANSLLEPWAGATAVERIEQIFTELLEDEEDDSGENDN